jgi:hypothetical protein
MPLITIKYGLPFVSILLRANGQTLTLTTVLLDSGSAACVFRTELLETIGVVLEGTDTIRFMTGIGGREGVIEKQIDVIEVGDLRIAPFTIQMGELAYGFEIDGILGSDFLFQAGAQINFKSLTIEKE